VEAVAITDEVNCLRVFAYTPAGRVRGELMLAYILHLQFNCQVH
jgi:hypothetical protein